MRTRAQKLPMRAFTLIELLVVIAMIAILASLLASTLSTAKGTAKVAVCKSNLRQCALALLLYTENYEAYPQPYRYLKTTKLQNGGTSIDVTSRWTDLLEEFFSQRTKPTESLNWGYDGKVLLCPVYPERSRDLPFEYTPIPTPQYGYNERGGGASRGDLLGFGSMYGPELNGIVRKVVRTSDVTKPDDMIALGDRFDRATGDPLGDRSLEISGSWGGPGWGAQVVPGCVSYDSFVTSPKAVKMHRSTFNRSFCDGHIEMEDFKRPFGPTDSYMRRWNLDNDPHRELWQ